MPAFSDFLHRNQYGFIPGRKINDNIYQILDVFYEALEKKKQLYFLFLDFRNAFDSVKHDFLLKLLFDLGAPSCFINSIANLIHNMQVITTFNIKRIIGIQIKRVVKEGCSLYPILFNILIHIIIHKLESYQQ